ncbi:L-arabinose isomerase [Cytobacillus firmus]|uniref:L-arabinose isomerase n=1 Tax=Cytobacillus firmus TaxID=1399 RepID=A0A800NAP4_CYTFI|nr:L-arabinose isomerase [Cytobacillus firmus]KAF0823750.1 L-arabinose isomerase [Cytobacillus firmus]MBG9549226.1 arabinose isomerase [Cytobacillus firmus]MBG9602073.1 arabinose isomerase [Cytobacillus firmus]MDD9310134.1 L-arabinose isomerase [Cytobacillus firmus]MED1940450.1 L-arabinose isomerase [Cytobacillus firmus]
MLQVEAHQFWFVAGSQHLYGEEALKEVEHHAAVMADELNRSGNLPFKIEFKAVLTNSADIHNLILEANANKSCAGLMTWMHTFSPGKMWIRGLSALQKPLLHLHTQYNRDIPWESIDMDFMNLNQSAHGDREFGFTAARLKVQRKVVAGYWKHADVQKRVGEWMKTAVTLLESRRLKIARFGDNMRNVAVTEGDKIQAQIKFGWTVDYYGIGDLAKKMNEISEEQVSLLFEEYKELYEMETEALEAGPVQDSIKEQARMELGLKAFLHEGNYTAFTTNFEDLHGMKQLPGLAVQRLMAQGYGFAGEGDWKTAAMTRLIKILSDNRDTSFMEDYTYHFDPENEMVFGSHMLEVCPTISAAKPKVLVRPLGIGGKEDPARLVFDGKAGKGIVASLVEMGSRFRLVLNKIEAVRPIAETPNLPVAKVLWKPLPSLSKAAEAWIYAGGSHHTVFSLTASADQLYDLADMFDIECVTIDQDTDIYQLRQELKMNEVIWKQ